ncbi:MAG: hypothetical protein HC911_04165 [Chloroflexaceae bacterium]|nr:hypothetical protein [Chloroflexaceae bacterium]
MYIRWVIRSHKNATVANTTFHDAYLVESYRDDEGNPRQRTICYLGNIRQIDNSFPPIERELFLLRVDRILASIPELTAPDRSEVVDMLQQKVQPLSLMEIRVAFLESVRWYRRSVAEHGMMPSDAELLEMLQDTRGDLGPL